MDRHTFLFLYHYCLQWPEKLERLQELEEDHTPAADDERKGIGMYMGRIRSTAEECSPIYAKIILQAVTTEGFTFERARAESPMPIRSEVYHNLLRRFYWLLSQKKLFTIVKS